MPPIQARDPAPEVVPMGRLAGGKCNGRNLSMSKRYPVIVCFIGVSLTCSKLVSSGQDEASSATQLEQRLDRFEVASSSQWVPLRSEDREELIKYCQQS